MGGGGGLIVTFAFSCGGSLCVGVLCIPELTAGHDIGACFIGTLSLSLVFFGGVVHGVFDAFSCATLISSCLVCSTGMGDLSVLLLTSS